MGALVVGAVLQVVAEMGQSAASWQLSFDLAPAERVGEYRGFFGTGVTVARTLGPLVLLVEWGTPGVAAAGRSDAGGVVRDGTGDQADRRSCLGGGVGRGVPVE